MSQAPRSALRAAFGILSFGVLLSTFGLAAKAQDLDLIPCSEIGPHYSQRIHEVMSQANACHKRVSEAGRYNEPWTSISDGLCSFWGPRICAGPVRQCSAVQSQFQQAQRECRRQVEATRLDREHRASEERQARQSTAQPRASQASLMSGAGMRSALPEPVKSFGEKYLKRFGWALVGPDSPSEYFQGVHQRPVGTAMQAAYHVDKSWNVATAAWNLSKAWSGPKAEKDRALLALAQESALRSTSGLKDPARMFSTFSFLFLKSFQSALLDELNMVSAQIALFNANNQMTRAEQDMWYSGATARWAEYVATTSAAAATGVNLDMSTAELVNEVRVRVSQAVAAAAQAIKAQREAQERAEQAEREAQEARDEQARRAHAAALRAQEQQLLLWEAEQDARRRAEQQRALNSIVGGIVGGITSMPRPAPTYIPPRQTYNPPPRPPRAGGGGGGLYVCLGGM
jgi:hypothetical protein